jgi:lipoyl(octanoyl) transferase
VTRITNEVAPHLWRLVDDVQVTRSGADQMHADVELMNEVRAGSTAALRLYTWASPALSLGRFQPETDVDTAACERHRVEVVRRPTGGAALLHGSDLTYAVAMPVETGSSVQSSYDEIARALIAGLTLLGIDAAIARNDGPPGAVCFAGQQGADLRVGNRKVCGSAQLRRDGVVLQHGSILLRRLAIDETDLIMGSHSRDQLRQATVTLDELGAPHEPRVVADALITGFAHALGITYREPLRTEGTSGTR